MEVREALLQFVDICLGQRTLPDSFETLGLQGEYLSRIGRPQSNLIYDAASRYAHPVSDTVYHVCSTVFEATIRDCNSKVSAREMSRRFARFMVGCLSLSEEAASSFVIPLGTAGSDLEHAKDNLLFCFEEIFDSLKGRKDFEPKPVATEIEDLARRLKENGRCRLENSFSLYLNKFRKRLHLEKADGASVSLESIYVEPEYVYCPASAEEMRMAAPLKDVVEAFARNGVSRFGGIDGEARVMTLLGQPGVGKTSFLQFLASEHASGRFCPEKTICCVPLRDLASSEFASASHPIKYIKDGLGLAERELGSMLLVLDGLDELCLVLSAGTSINDFYLSLVRDADNYSDCHILVTSRLNYVSAVFSASDPTIVFELKEFSWKNAQTMIDNIARAREAEVPGIVVESLRARFRDYPFLTVPLLLYTVVALEINVGDVDEVGQLYDKIFAEMTDRSYGVSGRQLFSEAVDPRKLARAFASEMRRRGRKHLDSFEAKAALSRMDAFLPEGDEREAIEKSYGLTFFYEKKHPELFAPEFLHLTFVEFLAAERIYLTLAQAIEMNEASELDEGLVFWWKEMDYLFSGADLSDQVVDFFRYKVESGQGDLPKEKVVGTMLEWLFSAFLDKGMVYSAGSSDVDNCVEKASRLFVGYWRLMKCLSPDESILDGADPIERTDFLHFLRVASRYSDVPLSFRNENLALCDMRDLDLSYCDLSGADMSQSNLSFTRLRDCDLTGADFLCSCLDMTDFTRAHMNGTRIAYAYSEFARFDNIDVSPDSFCVFDEMLSECGIEDCPLGEAEKEAQAQEELANPPSGYLVIDEEQEARGTFFGLAYWVMKPDDDVDHADLLAKREDAKGFWDDL